jgi:hypothetical protein
MDARLRGHDSVWACTVLISRSPRRAPATLLFAARASRSSFFLPPAKPKGTERRLAPRSRAHALRHGSTSCERCAPSGAPSRLCLVHLASGETGPRTDFLGRDFDGYYPLWVSPSPADEAAGRSCCRPAGPRGLPGAWLRRPCARAPHHRKPFGPGPFLWRSHRRNVSRRRPSRIGWVGYIPSSSGRQGLNSRRLETPE